MTYGIGHWFHSRVASSKREREAIVGLVEASRSYGGLRWSGSKTSSQNIQFSSEIGVNPSQMQTKIRAFMRFGFIKEDNICPLRWTKLGEIWRSLVINGGKNLTQYTDIIEELIIASSLALYSFNDSGFTVNPSQNYRPIFELLQNLDNDGLISYQNIQKLIGQRGASGSNYSYWITDLKNAGILEEITGGFKLTNKFQHLFNAIRTVALPTNVNDNDWKELQNDTLNTKNPYIEAILSEMQEITQKILGVEGALPLTQKEIVAKMIDSTNSHEDIEIEHEDYHIEDSYSEVKIRRKQSAWSNKVRKDYDYKCCIPECDVESKEFLQSAHIKKYNEKEEGNGHRANPHNGLCLCPLCHLMFDKGYFTLDGYFKIIISPQLSKIKSERLMKVIKDSKGKKIKMPRKYPPEKEYIVYHEKYIFMH